MRALKTWWASLLARWTRAPRPAPAPAPAGLGTLDTCVQEAVAARVPAPGAAPASPAPPEPPADQPAAVSVSWARPWRVATSSTKMRLPPE